MSLVVRGLLARSSGFTARFEIDLELDGVTALLGPSGAGKSTLLRCIAGLEQTAALHIALDGEVWQGAGGSVPAHRRPVSMVFQDDRLFPHLTVAGNLGFPLKRPARAGTRLDYEEVLDLLALAPLLDRFPSTLSGGQRQRVALGRALLAPARLWLFDEPLSALDPVTRREIAPYIAKVCRERAVPVLYVTHALDEVHHLASRVLVMENGQIVANQPIEALPAITPVDEQSRGGSVVECRFFAHHAAHDLSELRLGPHPLFVRGHVDPGGTIRLLIPARDVSIAVGPVSGLSVLNRLPGIIEDIEAEDAGSCLIRIRTGGQQILARITRYSNEELELVPGRTVTALVKSVALARVAGHG